MTWEDESPALHLIPKFWVFSLIPLSAYSDRCHLERLPWSFTFSPCPGHFLSLDHPTLRRHPRREDTKPPTTELRFVHAGRKLSCGKGPQWSRAGASWSRPASPDAGLNETSALTQPCSPTLVSYASPAKSPTPFSL